MAGFINDPIKLTREALAVSGLDLGMDWEVFLEDGREETNRARLHNGIQSEQVPGYGLVRYQVSGLSLEMQEIAAAVNTIVVACDGFCDSGGPGSTSCSIGGCLIYPFTCSVSCSKGYNACCRCLRPIFSACCKCSSC